MHSHLDTIKDWSERARRARWKVAPLARKCGLGERQLRRFFRSRFRAHLHIWLRHRSLEYGLQLLGQKHSIKEAAEQAGFKHPANFARAFKGYYGVTPKSFHLVKKPKPSQKSD